jgi:hypothetical protein
MRGAGLAPVIATILAAFDPNVQGMEVRFTAAGAS